MEITTACINLTALTIWVLSSWHQQISHDGVGNSSICFIGGFAVLIWLISGVVLPFAVIFSHTLIQIQP